MTIPTFINRECGGRIGGCWMGGGGEGEDDGVRWGCKVPAGNVSFCRKV